MADEEDYGVGRVRIVLDDSAAVADSQALGRRIERALDRATRNLGRTIARNARRGLTAVSVQVLPNVSRFAEDLADGLQGLDPVAVSVVPDVGRFRAELAAQLQALADVAVPVVPDVGRFRAELAAQLQALADVEVGVVPDAGRFRTLLAAQLLALDDVTVGVVPATGRFRTELAAQLRDLELSVTVLPDLSRFDGALLAGLRGLDSLDIPVLPDLSLFLTRLRAALAGEEVQVRVVPDLSDFDARIRAHRPPDVTVRVNPDVDTNRLSRALSRVRSIAGGVARGLGGLLAFGAVGIAAANAAAGVGAFLAALAPAAGIVAAFPAALLTSAAALGALKLALSGVGEAFSAALTEDAKKFEETLEGLSPKARAAAQEVRALKPAFEDLRATVQDAFFEQIEGQITRVAEALGGTLEKGLARVSANFGRAAAGVAKFLQSTAGVRAVADILTGTEQATKGLATSLGPVAAGFLRVAASVSEAFGARFGAALADAGARLGSFLERAATSGRAVSAVSAAVAVFQQLGAIISNVGSIISGVFQAGAASGAGFLANLERITQSFSEFVNSARGQEAIGNLFATIGTIAAQLGPILAALVTQIGAIAPALAPVFTALGPALVGLINALGPALAAIAPALATVGAALADTFNALASSGALTAVGQVVGSLLTALSPLLPLVGALANTVLQLLAPAFQAVLAVLTPVIAAIVGALMPILPPLTAAFQSILQAVIPLGVALGQALGQAITSLGPLLTTLAEAVAQVVVAFTPFVTAVVDALIPVLPPLVEAFQQIVEAVLPLVPPLAQLVASLAPLAVLAVQIAAPLIEVAAALTSFIVIEAVVPIIEGIVAGLTGLASALTTVVEAVTSFAELVIAGFQYLYDTLVGNSIVPDLITGIVGFFLELPGKILGALASLVAVVVGLFRGLASAALGVVSGAVRGVVEFFSSLPERVGSVLSSLPGRVESILSRAGSAAAAAARDLVGAVLELLGSLPGRAASALSGAGSALVQAGRELIEGMVGGIRSAAGSLVSAARDVVGGAVGAAKGALGISSPSKVFAEIGRDTGLGFIKGLTGTASDIEQTAKRLADSITRAFRGRKTTVDDRLVDLLEAGNKRLQRLASQREALAKRIADAQKFAADTTAAALQSGALQGFARDGQVNADNIIDGLRNAVDQIEGFTRRVNALARRGVRKDLLSQIIGLGPEQGDAFARALASTDKRTLQRINNLQSDLAEASTRLGRRSADILFDAGRDAGRGFLAGLKDQREEIEDLMLDIARGIQRAIRGALRIKSPSRVFAEIGDMTGAGLQQGLLRRFATLQSAVQDAARDVADAVGRPFAALPGQISGSLGEAGALMRSPAVGLLGEAPRLPGARGAGRRGGQRGAAEEVVASAAGGRPPKAAPSITNTFNITEVGDARATAHRVVTRLTLAGAFL